MCLEKERTDCSYLGEEDDTGAQEQDKWVVKEVIKSTDK
jgi:hypothetical protein